MRVADGNVTVALLASVCFEISNGSFDIDSSFRVLAVLNNFVALGERFTVSFLLDNGEHGMRRVR